MDCLDFQTVTAIIDATASFRHFKLALCNMSSERILSESFVFAIVRAVALMALLISSVTHTNDRSSLFSLTGIVSGQAERILPMSNPFANVFKTCGGIEKLSLDMIADLELAALASF